MPRPPLLELEITGAVIRLIHQGQVVFEEGFSAQVGEMDVLGAMQWLRARAILLEDEFRDGAFDTNGELDPWEPD